jgi:hypothetical protein
VMVLTCHELLLGMGIVTAITVHRRVARYDR